MTSVLQQTVVGYTGFEYVIGDLLWAKIGHHPYWPCMISYDPFEGVYYKDKKVRRGEFRIFHVQYFGKKVDRGWTAPGQIFLFEGLIKYEEKKSACANSSKYNVSSAVRKDWTYAVEEAEVALKYPPRERFETFVFKYSFEFSSNGTFTQKKSKTLEDCENKTPPKKRKISYERSKDTKLCKMCEEVEADVTCAGDCGCSFHKNCLGLLKVPVDFKCLYCDHGLHTCIVCKMSEFLLEKCRKCQNYYHERCIKEFECANVEKKICPAHICLTCHNENPRHVSNKDSFAYCFRCPSVFHSRESCLPVGSDILTSSIIVCPDHFLGRQRVSQEPPANVTYCSICSDGGDLICCEACPNSVHARCINNQVPDGDYFCEDCKKRRYCYYRMVVWAKLGTHRWWPAQIMLEEDIPPKIREMYHFEGEFVILFFGTSEYSWTHRGRVIPYAEHHRGLKKFSKSPKKQVDIAFNIALKEASEIYTEYVLQRAKERNDCSKPDAYKHIRVNRAVAPAQINVDDVSSHLPCSCVVQDANPCGVDTVCLNRSMLMECHPDVCKAKDLCNNQKFQKRQYASLKIIKTNNCGWGLEASEFIKKGSFVIEYVGEIITLQEYRKRVDKMREENIENYYFLYLDSRRMIDAGPKGNIARFINHSCSPNCEMVKWSVNGDARIGIFALTDIEPGQEITFNYQSDSIQFEQKCHCGAADCEGFIGRNGKKTGKKK